MSARTEAAIHFGESSTEESLVLERTPDRRKTLRSSAAISTARRTRNRTNRNSSDDDSELDRTRGGRALTRTSTATSRNVTTPRRLTQSSRAAPASSRIHESTRVVATTSRGNPARRNRRKQPVPQKLNFIEEVIKLQTRTQPLVPRLPFARLVREIIFTFSTSVTRITPEALEGLQVATEMYITQRLQDAYMLTLHRSRQTLNVHDLRLLQLIKAVND